MDAVTTDGRCVVERAGRACGVGWELSWLVRVVFRERTLLFSFAGARRAQAGCEEYDSLLWDVQNARLHLGPRGKRAARRG
jgi:hypothetical protein